MLHGLAADVTKPVRGGQGECRAAYEAYVKTRTVYRQLDDEVRCRRAYEASKRQEAEKSALSEYMYRQEVITLPEKPKSTKRVRTWTGSCKAKPMATRGNATRKQSRVRFDPSAKDDGDTVDVILDSGSDGHILPVSVMSKSCKAPQAHV